jgi:hypothetical protein
MYNEISYVVNILSGTSETSYVFHFSMCSVSQFNANNFTLLNLKCIVNIQYITVITCVENYTGVIAGIPVLSHLLYSLDLEPVSFFNFLN